MKSRPAIAIGALLCSDVGAASSIYLQPGQCIMVGSQQICALQVSATSAQETMTIYSCRYGVHKDTEVPDLKSYALVQIVISPDGRKTETSIKNYGMSGKEDCEKDADLRSKK